MASISLARQQDIPILMIRACHSRVVVIVRNAVTHSHKETPTTLSKEYPPMCITNWKTSLLVDGVAIPAAPRDDDTLDGDFFRKGDEIPLPIDASETICESADSGDVDGRCNSSQVP